MSKQKSDFIEVPRKEAEASVCFQLKVKAYARLLQKKLDLESQLSVVNAELDREAKLFVEAAKCHTVTVRL